jgi:TPR repeat protein
VPNSGEQTPNEDPFGSVRALLALRRYEAALTELSPLLAAGDAQAMCYAANALSSLDRRSEAAAMAERAIAADPQLAWAHRVRSFALSELGRFAEGPERTRLQAVAADAAREAVRLAPSSELCLSWCAYTELAAGDLTRSAASVRSALELRPDNPWTLLIDAQVALAQKDLARAEQSARQAIAAAPGHYYAWSILGTVFQASGRLDDYVAAYEQAARLNPSVKAVRQNLASGYLRQNLPSKAIEVYETVLDDDSPSDDRRRLWLSLGLAHMADAEDESSRQRAEHFLRMSAEAGEARAMFRLGLLREGQGRTDGDDQDGAIYWYRRAADAGIAQAMMKLALLRAKQGRTDEDNRDGAFYWFRRAADAGNTQAMNTLGSLRYRQGRTAEDDTDGAIDWFRKAANAGSTRSMNNLGSFRLRQGRTGEDDPDGAIHWYRKASDAGNALAMHNLGLIRARQGRTAEDDPDGAFHWWSLAASHGNAESAQRLARLRKARARAAHRSADDDTAPPPSAVLEDP